MAEVGGNVQCRGRGIDAVAIDQEAGFCHRLAAACHLTFRVLEPLAALLGAVNELFDVGEHARIFHLSAQLSEKRFYLGKNEEHLSADAGIEKKLLIF